jgi:hypothetical protein
VPGRHLDLDSAARLRRRRLVRENFWRRYGETFGRWTRRIHLAGVPHDEIESG